VASPRLEQQVLPESADLDATLAVADDVLDAGEDVLEPRVQASVGVADHTDQHVWTSFETPVADPRPPLAATTALSIFVAASLAESAVAYEPATRASTIPAST
jgi:hypothetical protein